MSSPLEVRLERYEGPLDLLLDLIRRQQIDIWDIPIARITAQYLEHIERAAELDIDLGAEFIFMAATLIHIKSRLLLPRDPELEKLAPEDDPRRELVERLLEHERLKNAAEMLQQKRLLEESVWSNPSIQEFLGDEDQPGLSVTLFDLVKTFQEVLQRTRQRPVYQVNGAEVSVQDMILYLRSALQSRPRGEAVPVRELFESQPSRPALICLFLAMLELAKLGALVLIQRQAFGDIAVRAHKRFEEVMASEHFLNNLEKDYH
ncbi:MAG: chromosome segregation protein ScpA [Acidobacteria bacterium]|nr:chromosome segregation protein ScpA [Acidobacteriota bacterium]